MQLLSPDIMGCGCTAVYQHELFQNPMPVISGAWRFEKVALCNVRIYVFILQNAPLRCRNRRLSKRKTADSIFPFICRLLYYKTAYY
jgi:hypothetical protein